MTTLTACAHAKLNLTLDVTGKRPDGYHDMVMVMQEISLGDDLTIDLEVGEGIRLRAASGEIPGDDTNLAVRAALAFYEAAGIPVPGMRISLTKNTPVCAGMGGGSADAAAVLSLLQAHYGDPLPEKTLYQIAENIGSDVPFALFGGTALAEGKGEKLTRLPDLPHCAIVLCKPPFPVSTPALFREIDSHEITLRPDTEAIRKSIERKNLPDIAANLCNVFQPLIAEAHPELQEIAGVMLKEGALNTCMSGSGPTMFGIFGHYGAAELCRKALIEMGYQDVFLVEPVPAKQ